MWETIKQILRKNQGTCIIVEEGKPAYVITKFEDYEKLLEAQQPSRLRENFSEQDLLEKINEEITNWKVKQVENAPELVTQEGEADEELKIENLPIV
jgi:PHD/YefM family antitoxin component YafN of YafNO toxin-antitoxin module